MTHSERPLSCLHLGLEEFGRQVFKRLSSARWAPTSQERGHKDNEEIFRNLEIHRTTELVRLLIEWRIKE